GLALQLPAPLGKPAEAALPLRYQTALTRETLAASGARPQDQLTLELGRLVQASYVRDLGGAEPAVLRGMVTVGVPAAEAPPWPERGVVAQAQLARFDAGTWQAALARAAGAGGTSDAAPAELAGGYFPDV